jgi:hypothetical protein
MINLSLLRTLDAALQTANRPPESLLRAAANNGASNELRHSNELMTHGMLRSAYALRRKQDNKATARETRAMPFAAEKKNNSPVPTPLSLSPLVRSSSAYRF